MGAVVLLSLVGAAPACGLAAIYWGGVSRAKTPDAKARRLTRAAAWTALAMALQAVSLGATILLALNG